MNDHIKDIILRSTEATDLIELEQVQTLWSGYGKIVRFGLTDSSYDTVIVKHISLAQDQGHPRGWNTDLSHQRKLKSYEVETHWYRHWSDQCDDQCRVPQCLACESLDQDVLIVMEDLDAAGFDQRRRDVSLDDMYLCLRWLAHFHATFMGKEPEGLWSIGTYWHLDTRPDELEVLDDIPLKEAAACIDRRLNQATYKTLVHGDAKLANFCFSSDGANVAAVDFQYVGGGCGMKDVAYFIGSCLHEEDCQRYEDELLDAYFGFLMEALDHKRRDIDKPVLEAEWRALFSVAWTDFHRFIKGWGPGHWKINSYSEQLARKTIASL